MNSVDLPQNLTMAPDLTRALTLTAKDEEKDFFRKGTSFRLYKKVLDTGTFTYHVYCSRDESK